MSDLDIDTGSNRSSNTVGGTTGLREGERGAHQAPPAQACYLCSLHSNGSDVHPGMSLAVDGC